MNAYVYVWAIINEKETILTHAVTRTVRTKTLISVISWPARDSLEYNFWQISLCVFFSFFFTFFTFLLIELARNAARMILLHNKHYCEFFRFWKIHSSKSRLSSQLWEIRRLFGISTNISDNEKETYIDKCASNTLNHFNSRNKIFQYKLIKY